jgi:hypothetical protein
MFESYSLSVMKSTRALPFKRTISRYSFVSDLLLQSSPFELAPFLTVLCHIHYDITASQCLSVYEINTIQLEKLEPSAGVEDLLITNVIRATTTTHNVVQLQ